MKKIISLIGIIFVFVLFCAFATGCGNASDVTTTGAHTVPGIETTSASVTTGTGVNTVASTTVNTTTVITTTKVTTKATTQATTKATTKATTTATTVEPKNITIFLDPGHGGSDPGVTRTFEGVLYKESDINLAVALFAKNELEKRGYTVVMSRKTDVSVGLYDRAPMAQNAGADMFISIHVNSYSNKETPVPNSVAGPRMFYTKRTGLAYNAYNFATYFAEEFDDIREVPLSTDPDKLAYPNMKLARIANDEDLYGKGGYLAVLAAKEIPSVLIEMGFITNDNDLMMLKSEWWQRYVGKAIADAVDAAYADGVYAK